MHQDGSQLLEKRIPPPKAEWLSQIKEEKDNGYNAVQLAYGQKSKNNTNKPTTGHLSKSGLETAKVLAEFKSIEDFEYKLGQQFDASIFNVGDLFFSKA